MSFHTSLGENTESFVSQTSGVFNIPHFTLFIIHLCLFVQGSIPASRGNDLGDHVTATKPNGGHVSYSDTSSAANGGKTSSEEFERIIQSMAQVKL